jgi:L-fucose mutarotase
VLKGIDPILSPSLLMHLCAMGHGEWVAVVDANFTSRLLAGSKPIVELPGLDIVRVSRAILSVLPFAEDISHPMTYMHVCNSAPNHRTTAQQAVIEIAESHGLKNENILPTERYAFYEQVRQSSLIVQTGETSAYGNVLFCKGVILTA